MDQLNIRDYLDFMFQRADAMLTFWNIYMAVITVIIGFITAGKKEWLNLKVCAVITFVFIVFAAGNYSALEQVRSQREALSAAVQGLHGYKYVEKIAAAAKPAGSLMFLLFHLAMDLSVIFAIWSVPFFRLKH